MSPHQTTLLKLLDSYLQPAQVRELAPDGSELRTLCDFLTREFFVLSTYTRRAISRALGFDDASVTQPHGDQRGGESRDPPSETSDGASASQAAEGSLHELDLLLPKVCEALVLVTQCLTSLALISEESYAGSQATSLPRPPEVRRATGRLAADVINTAMSPAGEGFVECLIGALSSAVHP